MATNGTLMAENDQGLRAKENSSRSKTLECIIILSSEDEDDDKKINKQHSPGLNASQNSCATDIKQPETVKTEDNEVLSQETTIRIVEAHSLAPFPNLWAADDIEMAKPSTSKPTPTSWPTQKSTDYLDSFLKELRVYGDPKDTESMDKVIKNLRKRACACPEEFLESQEFLHMTEKVLTKIRKDQKNFYVYLKEIFDEVKRYQHHSANVLKSKGNVLPNGNATSLENGKSENVSPTNHQADREEKKQTRIDKLYKLLEKLDKRIKQAQEKELSLDDMEEDDSHYIYEQKLKKKFTECYGLICKLEEHKVETGRAVYAKFTYNGTRYPEINKRVRRFITKEKQLNFPDFKDILNIVLATNQDSFLNISDSAAFSIAQEIFEDVGKELKRRRTVDLMDVLGSYLPDEDSSQDPAKGHPEVIEKLEKNGEECRLKMKRLLETFAEKQITMKLEPKEVDDENADKSPSRSEDEEEEGNESQQDASEDEDSDDNRSEGEIVAKVENLLGKDNEDDVENTGVLEKADESHEAPESHSSTKQTKRKCDDVKPGIKRRKLEDIEDVIILD